jgi:hypothetical protein
MKSFNRVATSWLIAGLLSLSACVFAGPGYGDRNARQAEARGDHDNGRHDDERRNCDSEHQRDGCQAEHH